MHDSGLHLDAACGPKHTSVNHLLMLYKRLIRVTKKFRAETLKPRR